MDKICFLPSKINKNINTKGLTKTIRLINIANFNNTSSLQKNKNVIKTATGNKINPNKQLQIINKYVKYLGNTYHSLTLNKIQVITTNLRYRLYLLEENKNIIKDAK